MTEPKRIPGYVCPKCKWFDVAQVTFCPRCHGQLQQTLFTGRGKIASYTVIRYPPKGFEDESPYVVALVDLEDGPRVMGRINAKPEDIQIGTSVSFLANSSGKLEFSI
jgi:uncharacterized OB-fold protein